MLETLSPARNSSLAAPTDVATLLIDVLSLTVREIRNDLRTSKCHADAGVTIPQFRILANLWIEPANNKTLAEAAGLSVPATSRMVKLLEKKGLVDRSQGVKDRREVRVRLTSEGATAYLRSVQTLGQNLGARMRNIPDAKLRKVESGLTTLKLIFTELSEDL